MIVRLCIDQVYHERLDNSDLGDPTIECCLASDENPGWDALLASQTDELNWWDTSNTECVDITGAEFETLFGVRPKEGEVFLAKVDGDIEVPFTWVDIVGEATDFHNFTQPCRQASKEIYERLLRR